MTRTRYLVDTHIAIFLMNGSNELEKKIREFLEDCNNLVYVSTISVQEMLYLQKQNKLKSIWKSPEDILKSIETNNFQLLPVKKEHLATFAGLSTPPDHHDPNDHMLISQAITEKMCMVSSDKQFRNYSDKQFDLFFNHR
ncbi:hypothetical protein SAMD00024442_7_55 [Candidatus Symbiothrix dinenymphae]|nr:hypothetical protein SAMD00024442_7_55 [Candidatus Symbiothrix dinenymphae]